MSNPESSEVGSRKAAERPRSEPQASEVERLSEARQSLSLRSTAGSRTRSVRQHTAIVEAAR